MANLNIWVGLQLAATLSEAEDQFTFTYHPDWVAQKGFTFSPHLPLDRISSGAAVRHFFSNLLPEGQNLEGLSSALQVSRYDVFGLLKKIGRDCAGALVILADGEQPDLKTSFSLDDYEQLDETDLNQRIQESNAANTPVLFWKTTPRMSLAGVQNKISLYMDEVDKLYLPKASAPTSHILKPDTLGDHKHPAMVANEYFCMRLAKAIGLDVPDVIYKTLPIPVYLVKRYDRVWTAPQQLIRSHQIDACQALNLPPSQKYEREYENALEGANLQAIFSLSNLCAKPALAQKKLLEWLLFNYLIGNSDAHAKNISFMINPCSYSPPQITIDPGMHVAPLYDLVSGVVYGYQEMAQSIGDNTRFDWVGYADWQQFAQETQLPWALLQKMAKTMLTKLTRALPKLAHDVAGETEPGIIDTIVSVIECHRDYLSNSLKI